MTVFRSKIASARVLCVGAGGLGSPAALYLAAAGVRAIGIIDADAVDLSNLQRQILHTTQDVGRRKVSSARDRLAARHPALDVRTHDERLCASNAAELFAQYDVVVDGSDNFATKFLANDAAVLTRKPLVHGGILRWFGQVLSVRPFESACYRCIFESPPPRDEVPSCAEAGVVGAVAGVLGVLMAIEALKLVASPAPPLLDRILTYDALGARFREIPVRRNVLCAVCGPHATIRALDPTLYLATERAGAPCGGLPTQPEPPL
jgi:adenylyltransferase/sulfurtransferase